MSFPPSSYLRSLVLKAAVHFGNDEVTHNAVEMFMQWKENNIRYKHVHICGVLISLLLHTGPDLPTGVWGVRGGLLVEGCWGWEVV